MILTTASHQWSSLVNNKTGVNKLNFCLTRVSVGLTNVYSLQNVVCWQRQCWLRWNRDVTLASVHIALDWQPSITANPINRTLKKRQSQYAAADLMSQIEINRRNHLSIGTSVNHAFATKPISCTHFCFLRPANSFDRNYHQLVPYFSSQVCLIAYVPALQYTLIPVNHVYWGPFFSLTWAVPLS